MRQPRGVYGPESRRGGKRMSLSEAQREIAETSGPAQLGAFTLMATQKLSVADRKKLAIDTVKDLSEQDKKDVVAGLGSPDQDATDFIWKLVVGVFSLILVGAVFVLGLGRF